MSPFAMFLLEVLRVLVHANQGAEVEERMLYALIRKTNDELARRRFNTGEENPH